jgi:hypothetical protein
MKDVSKLFNIDQTIQMTANGLQSFQPASFKQEAEFHGHGYLA